MLKYPIFVAGRDMTHSWQCEGRTIPKDEYDCIVTAPRPKFDAIPSVGLVSAWVCDRSKKNVTLDFVKYAGKGIPGSWLTPANPRDAKLLAEARDTDSHRGTASS